MFDQTRGRVVLGEVGQRGTGQITVGRAELRGHLVGELRLRQCLPQVRLVLRLPEGVDDDALAVQHGLQDEHRVLVGQRGDPVGEGGGHGSSGCSGGGAVAC
jgi:hypothetical protein